MSKHLKRNFAPRSWKIKRKGIKYVTKENIKKEALKYLDIFKDHPYIFNLGHGILPDTNPMMIDYLVKLVNDY